MGTAYDRGILLYGQKRYSMAAEEFRKELAAVPDSARAHSMLALCLLYQKLPQAAASEIAHAIRLGPDVAFVHYAQAHVTLHLPIRSRTFRHRRMRAAQVKRLQAARRQVLEAIRLDHYRHDYFSLLTAIEMDLQRWGPALSAAERGLAIAPNHAGLLASRAQALLTLGRSEEADRTIDQAMGGNAQSPAAHSARGWAMLRLGNARQAVDHFRESLRLDPNNKATTKALKQARWAAAVPPYAVVLRTLLITSGGRPQPLMRLMYVAVIMAVVIAHEPLRNHLWLLLPLIVGLWLFLMLSFRPLMDFVALFDREDRAARQMTDRIIAVLLSMWMVITVVFDGVLVYRINAHPATIADIALSMLLLPPSLPMTVILLRGKRPKVSSHHPMARAAT